MGKGFGPNLIPFDIHSVARWAHSVGHVSGCRVWPTSYQEKTDQALGPGALIAIVVVASLVARLSMGNVNWVVAEMVARSSSALGALCYRAKFGSRFRLKG